LKNDFVIPALVAGIQTKIPSLQMDCRDKPGNDKRMNAEADVYKD